jgi:hypothetical protein
VNDNCRRRTLFQHTALNASRRISFAQRSCVCVNLLPIIFAISIGALLFNTYRLYKGTYFWLDDFNNLYWVQRLVSRACWETFLTHSQHISGLSG